MKGKIDIKDHDSCGTGVLFNKNNKFAHSVIERSLLSLSNMKHRGALSYDGMTTDGCGILLDIDRKFFQKKLLEEQKLILPNNFSIAVLMVQNNFDYEKIFLKICSKFNLKIIAKREVDAKKNILGELAQKSCPKIIQIFVAPKKNNTASNHEP